jgi:phospholipid transport system transporter-binding protein
MSRKADSARGIALTCEREGDVIGVSGELSFASAHRGIEAFRPHCLPTNGTALTLDLSAVTRTDSGGLALLLHWKRMAHAAGRPIRFLGLPEQTRNLAAVFGIADLLGSSNTS